MVVLLSLLKVRLRRSLEDAPSFSIRSFSTPLDVLLKELRNRIVGGNVCIPFWVTDAFIVTSIFLVNDPFSFNWL